MGFGNADARAGGGRVAAKEVRQATLTVPSDCSCSWFVVIAGPGMKAVSELRYVNSLCPHVAEHERARQAARAGAGAA